MRYSRVYIDAIGYELAPVVVSTAELEARLQPLYDRAPASIHLRRLIAFFTSHVPAAGSERDRRAQAAILGILDALAAAHAAHDDRETTIDDLAPDIRRWIEDETFVPEDSNAGLQVVDDQAARYGEFDDLFLVGLVEGEWPERPRRNIFFPPALLATLGWPSEKDRRSAAAAAFIDLVRSARGRVALSTFSLDDDALVEPSLLAAEVVRARLATVVVDPPPLARVFPDEALSLEPFATDSLGEAPRAWAELRLMRSAATDERFHGSAGSQRPRPLSVSDSAIDSGSLTSWTSRREARLCLAALLSATSQAWPSVRSSSASVCQAK